ncbi:MAG: DUF748 domain-containing protein [Candidatus Binatia bacterium]
MRFLAWIWSRRWWQWNILALAALVLTFVVLLPRFLRGVIEAQLAQATTARAHIGDVALNVFRQSLTIHDVTLTLPKEKQAIVAVKQLRGIIELSTLLLRREVVIKEIRLVDVQVAAVLQKDGHLNLAKLLAPSPPDPVPETDLPTLTVERIRLEEVGITFRNLTRAPEAYASLSLYEVTAGAINLQAQGLAAPVQVQIRGELNTKTSRGGSFAGEGQAFWNRSETRIKATLNLEQFALALVEPYLREVFAGQHLAGAADGTLRYHLQSGGEQPPAHVLSGAVTVADLSFVDPSSNQSALRVASGQVVVEGVDFLHHDIRIASIVLRDPELFLLQTNAGLNWVSLFPRQTENVAQTPGPQDAQRSWRYVIGNARLNGGEVLFRDESWPEAEMVKIVPTQFELGEIRSGVQETPMRFQFAVGVGKVTGEGTLSFAPVGVKVQASLSELWLTPLHPLLVRVASVNQIDAVLDGNLLMELTVEEGLPQLRLGGTLGASALFVDGLPAPDSTMAWKRAQLEVGEGSTIFPALDLSMHGQISDIAFSNTRQGNVSVEFVDGDLRLTRRNPGNLPAAQQVSDTATVVPEMSIQGRIGVKGFVVRQGPHNTEVLSWYQAQAELQEGSHLAPLDLRFAEIALEYPYVQGFRTKDGVFQLAKPSSAADELQVTPVHVEEAVPTPTEQEIHTDVPAPAVSPLMQITHASIIGGQLYFEDEAVTPSQTIYWQDIRIDLNGVGYPFVRPTAFTLHAFNMDGAPIEVNGSTKRQGQQLVTQVEGTIDRLTISRFNVYLAPQLGYRVRQGSVSVKWKLVMPGDLLRADATVTLHDFGLGGKESASGLEEQVGLPMSLIVALLKDLNGDINLQLPVEGRLNEPGFRAGGTVWRAIRDVLIGAVTSPLKLLGALFRKENSLKDFALNPIGFEPGTSRPDAAGSEQLTRLKLFLSQRPEVDLRLSGSSGAEDLLVRQDQIILARLQSDLQDSLQSGVSTMEQGNITVDAPSEEVRKFLTRRFDKTKKENPTPLSDQASALLAQLRKDTTLDPQELQQLAQDRVEAVITALTEGAAVSTKRLHVSPKRVRGRGEPEVQYVIQAGEEK